MSRFEPNVEPSMEEILASIRKIIAEDTSGSRTVPPPAPSASRAATAAPVRPSAGVKPAAPQQRGFMSREAFMKTPAPADEPAGPRFFTPVTPPQDTPSTTEPAARSVAPEVSPAKAVPPSSAPSMKAEAKPVETAPIAATASNAGTSDATPKPADQDKPTDKSVVAEAKAIVDAAQPSAAPAAKSEAQIIDAQLVELLGEDLKALREADERQDWKNAPTLDAAAKVAPSPEAAAPKPSDPAAKINGAASSSVQPPAAAREETPDARDNSDPFAFDLGPSPFLPRALIEKAPERKAPTDAPLRSSAPQRDELPHPPAVQEALKINGAPAAAETVRQAALTQRAPELQSQVSPTSAPRPAPFAVPSVSATLGPHRKLEPLSEAFRPAAPAPAYGKPAERHADPFPFHDLPRSAEPPPEPPRVRIESRLQPAPPPPLSALPPLDVEADALIGGDRTMEDAVADLLRPLLKTWLAENMPKIVERALRREMTERLLPPHKNARD